MDKSWMNLARFTEEYFRGLESFLEFAFLNVGKDGTIVCPCKECKLIKTANMKVAREHLLFNGFIKNYKHWSAHGETSNCTHPTNSGSSRTDDVRMFDDIDDMNGMVHDAFGIPHNDVQVGSQMGLNRNEEIPSETARTFIKLIEDSEKKLYEGCENFSKLSFIIRLLHIKVSGNWSNHHFDLLLCLLREAFPEAMSELPKSYYEANKLMKDLGLRYEKIDACRSDCILYWGVNAELNSCPTCDKPRWRPSVEDPTGIKKKIAFKVLWYFPIKPRLQRLFMSSKIAIHMRWHNEGRTKDGYMRHPADSPAWQSFDNKYNEFAREPRNVRLGLSSDGFNPFGNNNVSHSTWPVVLTPYNLPPWMCMKQQFFFLSLLIPGKTAPGNNIDVYMQPLIADLKELWEVGIETYDASMKENFVLRASVMWTISDFPGYANLSGWSTKGALACPVCHEFTDSCRLKHGGKYCYMGHRRFLDRDHRFRKNARSFNGKEEYRRPPRPLSGDNVFDSLKDINFTFGKDFKDNPNLPLNWKKRSIFFELPYWKDNVVRHNLDVMHIEKNICESICGTLLDIDGKSKDNLKSRRDLEVLGIRPELHPVPNESGKSYLPPACYKMSKKEKEMFCKVLRDVKVPDGYSSNISRKIQSKPLKLVGLKSHDYHILMQQLLPISLRKTLPNSVCIPLLKLSRYFRELCSKVINPAELLRMEKDIAIVLCELEKVFPPSFFDISLHLAIHLSTEVRLAGPVFYRWMYPIERYLGTLKSYVRNKSRPEGSIATGYLADECLTFCSLYLSEEVETKYTSKSRNENLSESTRMGLDIFTITGHAIGKGTPRSLDDDTITKAHQYVLFNCETVTPYIQMHLEIVESENPRLSRHNIERLHSREFGNWFSDHIKEIELNDNDPISHELKLLARGPNVVGVYYDKYLVNGFRFHTKHVEKSSTTQNSGVTVNAVTSSFSSMRDENPIEGDLEYYGVLTEILQLDYVEHRVVLFKCDWVSKGKRLKQDADGFTMVNFSNVRPHDEPFILSSQAAQVFYITDPVENDWQIVISASARGVYNMEPMADVETFLQSTITNTIVDNETEDDSWVRGDVDGDDVDEEMVDVSE